MMKSLALWVKPRGRIAALLACSLPAAAANIGKDIPLGNFDDRDMQMFQQALDNALDKGADGTIVTWANPDSKAAGEVKPLKTFERAGAPCRVANIANHAKGRSSNGPFTFCKAADGKWTLAPTEKP
jgi:surface antigen